MILTRNRGKRHSFELVSLLSHLPRSESSETQTQSHALVGLGDAPALLET